MPELHALKWIDVCETRLLFFFWHLSYNFFQTRTDHRIFIRKHYHNETRITYIAVILLHIWVSFHCLCWKFSADLVNLWERCTLTQSRTLRNTNPRWNYWCLQERDEAAGIRSAALVEISYYIVLFLDTFLTIFFRPEVITKSLFGKVTTMTRVITYITFITYITLD